MMHAGFPGQRIHDTRATVDCKYYLEGRCTLGDNCPFRHRPVSPLTHHDVAGAHLLLAA